MLWLQLYNLQEHVSDWMNWMNNRREPELNEKRENLEFLQHERFLSVTHCLWGNHTTIGSKRELTWQEVTDVSCVASNTLRTCIYSKCMFTFAVYWCFFCLRLLFTRLQQAVFIVSVSFSEILKFSWTMIPAEFPQFPDNHYTML